MSQPHPNARIFVDFALLPGSNVTLDKAQSHYLATVLRQKEGDWVALFNGEAGEWHGQIIAADRKHMQLRLERQARPQQAEPDIWLLFAPIKFGKIDFLVQKITELGAAQIWPVQTARTVVTRLNEERLEANAREAAEQSERLSLPQIHPYQPLARIMDDWPQDRLLIYGDETHQGSAPAQLLPALTGQKLALLVGPEGGFSQEELNRLRQMPQARPLSLGPRILRADTAALAALSCVMAFTGEW